jgi:membrane associated rhomboid family serine protease
MTFSNDKELKDTLIKGLITGSVVLFGLSRHLNRASSFSIKTRFRWNEIMNSHFAFNGLKPTSLHTWASYSLQHSNLRHLGLNMALMFVLGTQLIEDERVPARDLGIITLSSAVSAAAAEAVSLTKPLVGASGIVMGYLGTLSCLEPSKTWLMILPIPGVPITTIQLAQVTVASHVGLLAYKGLFSPFSVAVRGHLAGLFAGYVLGEFFYSSSSHSEVNTRQHWQRTLTSAELAVYWMYISIRLMLPMPLMSESEKGLLRTKQRFVRRTWEEEF